MKSRTTLILAVVALLVAGLVVWDYQQGATTEQRRSQHRRLMEFKHTEVTGVTVVQSNLTIVIEKAGERWQLKQPLDYRADVAAVNSILDGLEFAQRDRTLTAGDLAGLDRAELGLTAPRYKVSLATKTGSATLLVGGPTPTGNAIYVQVEGQDEVLVTDQTLLNRFERALPDYRDRTVLDFDPALANRLELKSAERVAELVRAAGANGEQTWSIARPLVARADQANVADVLSSLAALRVAEFVSDDPKDVYTYRLSEPVREITIGKSSTEGAVTLLVGPALTNDATKAYAKLKTADAIFTVALDALQKSDLPIADLRDRRVLAFEEPAVHGIEIQRGTDRLVLTRTNDAWQITAPVTEPADTDRVLALLTNLQTLRAEQFTADVATDLEQYGLAVPAAILKLHGVGTNTLSHLLISAPDASNAVCHVKRESEPFIYGVTTNLPGWLPADHWAIRRRQVTALAPSAITKLEIQRPTGPVTIERDAAARWRLVAPAQGALNADDVEIVLSVLARLEADQFRAAPSPAAAQPDHVFTITTADKTFTLALAGLEATLSEPPLHFTLPAPTVQTLTKELLVTPDAAP